MIEVENFYDNFSEKQLATGINKRHISIYNWCIKFGLQRNSKILEIGCGIGTFTELIAKYCISGSIHAYDISKKNIEIATKRLLSYPNVTPKKGDATVKKFKSKFDFIILPDVLEHIPLEKHKKLFKSLEESLSDKGLIIIHIPNPGYLQWCHKNTPETLQVVDQPLFTNLLTESIYTNKLYIHYLKTYSIWIDNCDYQIIVLKKEIKKDYKDIPPVQLPLNKRIINKLKNLTK